MSKKITGNIPNPKIISFDKSHQSKQSSKLKINTRKFLQDVVEGSIGGDLSKYVE